MREWGNELLNGEVAVGVGDRMMVWMIGRVGGWLKGWGMGERVGECASEGMSNEVEEWVRPCRMGKI